MQSGGNPNPMSSSVLFGSDKQVGVARGLAEFRSGRPIVISGGGDHLFVLPVEGLDARRLGAFREWCSPIPPRLVITASRARSLGLDVSEPVALELPSDTDASRILSLVADAKTSLDFVPEPAGVAAAAGIELAKLAQILPSVLVADTRPERLESLQPPVVSLDAFAVARFRADAARSLTIAGEAQVPIESGMRTRFVVFRDAIGDNSVAVFVGTPDMSKPVPVRIHSACLTGDVFGSRRCDCGDQLRLAVQRLHEAGGGVVLYLAQEGRGLGLANKMRTYQLQDAGLDTVDANTTLGFNDDERDYGVAARMLQMLGCTRVMLMTNNPAKLEGLSHSGIEIAGRMPIETPINADNRRYMTAKAARAGHHLDHVLSMRDKTRDDEEKAVPLAP